MELYFTKLVIEPILAPICSCLCLCLARRLHLRPSGHLDLVDCCSPRIWALQAAPEPRIGSPANEVLIQSGNLSAYKRSDGWPEAAACKCFASDCIPLIAPCYRRHLSGGILAEGKVQEEEEEERLKQNHGMDHQGRTL